MVLKQNASVSREEEIALDGREHALPLPAHPLLPQRPRLLLTCGWPVHALTGHCGRHVPPSVRNFRVACSPLPLWPPSVVIRA